MVVFIQYGCQANHNPSISVVKDALEIQIELTDRTLESLLDVELDGSKVISLKVERNEYIPFHKGELLSISGHLDLESSYDQEIINIPFSVFLEKGEKGESWRLARPSNPYEGLNREWISYPLPI